MQKSYNCNQCGYSCNRPFMLVIHLLVHSGEKPFVCSWCNYSCTEAGTLKVHMRIHWGKRPYSCKKCDYSCARASILKQHLLSHSGEKTISVHSVHLFFCKKGCPQRATVNSLRGKAFQLWPPRNAFFLAQTQATWTIKCSHTLHYESSHVNRHFWSS